MLTVFCFSYKHAAGIVRRYSVTRHHNSWVMRMWVEGDADSPSDQGI